MAESQSQGPSELGIPKRFITDHDANGLAIFNTSIPELLPTQIAGDLALHFGYATTSCPADFSNQSDIATYTSFLSAPPGIFVSGGSVLRVVDLRPDCQTPLHMTDSLDYGVVLEGEVELVLDSGESRTLKRGDISVQRGTNHLWRNANETEWSRMLFVSLEAKPLEITGKD